MRSSFLGGLAVAGGEIHPALQRLAVEQPPEIPAAEADDLISGFGDVAEADARDVRGEQNVVHGPKRVVGRKGFRLADVQRRPRQVAGGKDLGQHVGVEKGTAPHVEQQRVGLHGPEGRLVEQAPGLRRVWQGTGHNVGAGKKGGEMVEGVHFVVFRRAGPGGPAHPQHPRAERPQALGEGGPNVARAEDQDGLSRNPPPGKTGLPQAAVHLAHNKYSAMTPP